MATISLGMIVKNEGRTLRACLESVVPHVDEVVIGFGGQSTDETEAIVTEFQNKVWAENPNFRFGAFHIEWDGDFAAARQQVLERTTGEYFLWIDGDDVLVGGEKLHGIIQTNPNVDAFYFGYDYAQDEDGLNICYLIRERLVMRHPELPVDWKWIGKVHEVLVPTFPPDNLKIDDIVVVHHKPPNKHEGDRNLQILYQQLRETEPNPDPRTLVYLGTENLGRGELREAILHLQRFVKVSGWDEERYQAQVKISHAYRTLGDHERALKSGQEAISMLPSWPDAYFSMAKTYAAMENWPAVLQYVEIGTQKPKPQTMLIINPLEYQYEPALLVAIANVQIGDYELALHHYQQAFSIKQDPVIAQTVQMLRQELDLRKTHDAFMTLREHLGRNDEWLKVRKLFDVVPKKLQDSTLIREVWQRTMEQTAHIENPQIMEDFYTGNPHWTPMDEAMFADPNWLKYPRMRYALEVARRVNAKTIVDWGCSDGFIALPLAKETGAHVVGFDIDPRCTELAGVRAQEWAVDARFEVGNVDQVRPDNWQGEKADLAIFFEVIEHVVEPEKTLERLELTAKHIAGTTPFMAWEDGNIPAWDKLEPKGHLRIFDTYDIERLLTGRGQIWNIYKEPWGPTGWIFFDYEPGVQLRNETIIIGAQMGLEPWGPRKLSEGGLGGSETAVIRLAESFAKKRRRPIVYNPIDSPGYYNGVCYRPVEHFRPEIRSDLYIAWRMPEAADLDINTRHLSLWFHDVDAGDRLTPERAKKFHSFVVLTEWHKKHLIERYPFIDQSKVWIIGNGVDVTRFEEHVTRNPKKVIYSSSPDRGLDIVLENIWPKVVEQVPDAELHVYYGWDTFDKASEMPGQQALKLFKNKINEAFLNTKNVVQHGRIPQDRLAHEMQEASIWLYPTYFHETYCITAVEAQLAGALPITNKLAALNETVRSGIQIEGDVHDPAIQEAYVKAVVHALTHPGDEALRAEIRRLAPAESWDRIAMQWEQLFEGEVDGKRPV